MSEVAATHFEDPASEAANAEIEKWYRARNARAATLGLRDSWAEGQDAELDRLIAENRAAVARWNAAVGDWRSRYLAAHLDEIHVFLRERGGSATKTELARCQPFSRAFGNTKTVIPGTCWGTGKNGFGSRLYLEPGR